MSFKPNPKLGLACAIGAQTIWGFFPIYINQFKGVIEPLEIVGHRAIWSFALLLGLFAIVRLRSPKPLPEATRLSTSNSNSQRSTPKNDANPYASPASTTEELLPAITRELDSDSKTKRSRLIGMGLIAAVLIAVNWLTYVWAVNNGRILDASLGYYICPQVIVLIGVFVLGERLGKVQWLAVAFASIGVLVMTQSAASTPWVGICLAVVWGLYGLVKKKTSLSATNGLMLETGILLVPALAMLTWQATHGQPIFGDSLWVNSLLVLSGAATVTPLALYAIALKHLRFSTIGLLQFLGPTIQFLLGAFESSIRKSENKGLTRLGGIGFQPVVARDILAPLSPCGRGELGNFFLHFNTIKLRRDKRRKRVGHGHFEFILTHHQPRSQRPRSAAFFRRPSDFQNVIHDRAKLFTGHNSASQQFGQRDLRGAGDTFDTISGHDHHPAQQHQTGGFRIHAAL